MKLREFLFTPKYIKKGIENVRQMPTVEQIGLDNEKMMSPAEFWRRYDAGEFK